MKSEISLTELESAINFWRQRSPSQGEELRLSREAAALATPYAMLIMTKLKTLQIESLDPTAKQAVLQWIELTGRN